MAETAEVIEVEEAQEERKPLTLAFDAEMPMPLMEGGAALGELVPVQGPEATQGQDSLSSALDMVLENYQRNLGLLGEADKGISAVQKVGTDFDASLPERRKLVEKLKTPEVTPAPKFQGRSEIEAFGSLGSVVALFGSMFARRPMTAAMHSLGASLEAIRKNDLETYSAQHKAWKDQTEFALKQADMENGIIKTIIDDDSKSWDQRLLLAKAYASSLGDKITASAAASGDIKSLVDLAGKKQDAVLRMRELVAGMKPERLILDNFISDRTRQTGVAPTAEEQAEFLKSWNLGDDQKAEQRKIDEIINTFGVDRQTAASIVLGTNKVVTDPITGQAFLVDMINQTSRPLYPTEPGETPRPAPATGAPVPNAPPAVSPAATGTRSDTRTFWDMAPLATGPISAVKDAASRVPFVGTLAPETVQARSAVKAMQNEFIRALAINPRFPQSEIERVKEEIDIGPRVIDNPNAYQHRLIGIEDALTARESNERRAGSDMNLPADVRKNAREAANTIRNFRKSLGLPQRFFTDEEANEGVKRLAPRTPYIGPDNQIWYKK